MKATLTEERAKDILEFLAKKYGYAGFEDLDKDELDNDEIRCLSTFACVIAKDNGQKTYSLDDMFKKTKKQKSYKSLLEFMLDTVSAGYDIGAFYHKYGDYMLKSHTTLEEILVEMDLKKIEEK